MSSQLLPQSKETKSHEVKASTSNFGESTSSGAGYSSRSYTMQIADNHEQKEGDAT